MTALEELFNDWLEAETSCCWEFSGSIARDLAKIREQGMARAEVLGITWTEAHEKAVGY